MSLSDAELAAVVAELAPRLRGSNVGKIYQPAPDTLLLELGRDRLLLSIAPRASRLHLSDPHGTEPPSPTTAEGARSAGKKSDEDAGSSRRAPSAFAMLLRKRIGGLRLHDLAAAAGERIVTLDFGPTRDRLVAELTGPHANVFLVDPAGAIVASQRPSHSTTRALTPGTPYTPPPAAPPTARWRGRNRFTTPAHPGAEGLAARVATRYAVELAQAEERVLREQVAAALRRDIVKMERRERALLGDLGRADEAAGYRKLADLLLAHAHGLPGRGAASATVPDDFEDGSPLVIALEPALDARENAARYYRLHKRFAGGRKQTETRLGDARRALSALRDRLDAVPSLGVDDLRARHKKIARRASPGGGGGGGGHTTGSKRAATREEGRLPYREYTSLAGDRILVGRGAADNDTLTFRVARGNDLWLHCRDAAGAHVVVPRSAATLAEATLLDAATLAAHFSPLGKEAQVDVTYAAVKNLRKPKGAAPGLVFVSDAKTIRVRLEPDRLARLLQPEAGDE